LHHAVPRSFAADVAQLPQSRKKICDFWLAAARKSLCRLAAVRQMVM